MAKGGWVVTTSEEDQQKERKKSFEHFTWKETKKADSRKKVSLLCGTTRNRTGDSRIFSPLLYQLSYGTIVIYASQGGKPYVRVQR